MNVYTDVGIRLEELVSTYAKVYAPEHVRIYRLISNKNVRVVNDPQEAQWMILDNRHEGWEDDMLAFSLAAGVADFLIIGEIPTTLPVNTYVVGVEEYNDFYITIGKRVN